jgi:hypothetical protein
VCASGVLSVLAVLVQECTNTDAEGAIERLSSGVPRPQFTCFTSTRVQIRTPEELAGQILPALLALLVQECKY